MNTQVERRSRRLFARRVEIFPDALQAGIAPEPLGRRESFADIAASLGIFLGIGPVGPGRHW